MMTKEERAALMVLSSFCIQEALNRSRVYAKNLTEGGIVYGPNGQFGEYVGADLGPEVVVPLNRLKDINKNG